MPVSQRQPEIMANRKKFGGKASSASATLAPTIKPNHHGERFVGKSTERNGLLLMSTKKSSSANASSSGGGGGGLLSTKAPVSNKPLPNLKTHKSAVASTHQVLLSAVVGASQVGETQAQPDAWGVADSKRHVVSLAETTAQLEEHYQPEQSANNHKPRSSSDDLQQDATASSHSANRYEMDASWDEYGGRGVQSGKLADDQYSHMSRLAKDRAAARQHEEDQRNAEQRHRAAQRLKELDDKTGQQQQPRGRGGGERKLWEPDGEAAREQNNNSHHQAAETPETPKEELIHLSSYEDRDRGMRTGSSAPRMLFDPKSGSMVEVKARDEGANAKRNKERKPRQRSKAEAPTENNKKNARKLKGRKDSVSSEKSESEKKIKASSARLPRTCGVLFARNEHGAVVCQDECDGDLGYGCHSVPGGRVRNAEGYQNFVNEHAEIFQKHREMMSGYEAGAGNEQDETNGLTLETGFNLEEPPQPLEWVKANDKIELVTGADDSPTLKPTAKEWAPSQAALAAAAAAAASTKSTRFTADVSPEDSGEDIAEEDEEEVDDEEEADAGLGFDPMDFMSSPSHLPHPEDAIASVDLKALSLEPSAFASGETSTKNNIFAFGSTTWTSSGGADHIGWGSSGANDTGATTSGLFGSDVFRSTSDDNSGAFLSMPTAHSWGSGPIPGLNLSANHDSTDG